MRKTVLSAFLLFCWSSSSLASAFNRRAISTDAFYTAEQVAALKFETKLSFLNFEGNGWTDELLLGHIQELAQVYLQCGLKLAEVAIYSSPDVTLPPVLEKFAKDGPTSLEALAAKALALPHPVVFLIGGLADTEASPFSRANFIDSPPVAPALRNTLWFPAYVNSPEYIEERKKSPYSSLAHELTHILTLDGDHNNDPVPNLMTIYLRRTNLLTPELCKEMLKSEFVKPVSKTSQVVSI